MFKFIKAIECPNCTELVKDDGLTVDFTTTEHVVCLNLFSQISFHCESCGADIYIGDIEDCLEYELPDEEEE